MQAADEHSVPFLASALTFDALLAAVPFILLLLVGLAQLAHAVTHGSTVGPVELFHGFFPPHSGLPGRDPFEFIEDLLAKISENSGQLSLYAVPAFIWFSTRLFGGVRTALNEIFDVSLRPPPSRHFAIAYLLGKLRDTGMVLATLVLFLANTVMTTGLSILQATGAAHVPKLEFFVSTLGRFLGEGLAFVFSISLFYVTYRYASVRRLPWRTALLASTFTAILFEVAKRLYGWYLANFASLRGPSGDANIGAVALFVVWVYYTALVFLLGAVVAETWELRRMQQRQRAVFG